ncbi:MAG: YihY/virulence factor BrkB family protein, partial [Kiritimatiellae bacterium]|nr:YihY/virulence factor BrkB family protein [Kiritimatiellia bacterium]
MKMPDFKKISSRAATAAKRAAKFATQDVWDVELSAMRGVRRVAVRAVRVLFMVARGFRHDECVLRASSLTFMSLLAVVPVLALSLSLAKGVMDGDEIRTRAREGIHKVFSDYLPQSAIADPAAEGAAAPEEAAPSAAADEGEAAGADAIAAPAATDGDGAAAPEADAEPPPRGLDEAFFQDLAGKAFDVVDRLNFRALGGIGLLLLIWTVVSLVGNVERAFNRVWGVRSVRPIARRFTDYLSVIVILPVLAIAASSVPVVAMFERKMNEVDGALGLPAVAGIPFFKGLWVVATMTLLFCFLLRFTPNTRVKWGPGLLGGFVAAVGFVVWLKICLGLQIGVAKYSAFFGSFAAVPILLSWLYVSWVVLLAACEVSFAAQNADTYEMERGNPAPSQRARLFLAAEMLAELSAAARGGDGVLRVERFNRARKIPVRFARDVARRLCEAGVLVPVADETDAWAPRVDLQSYTAADLAAALFDAGETP